MNVFLIAVSKPARHLRQTGFAAGRRGQLKLTLDRHATCMPPVFLEKDSHWCRECVHWSDRWVETAISGRNRPSVSNRRAADRRDSGRHAGRIQGAARNGNRKRTRVRVACGGGIRPRGLGHQPIHGHFGLSVVGRETLSPVVHQPACERCVRQRHLSRGPGLLAALTSRDIVFARTSASERPSALHQTGWATRPVGCTVTRAATLLQSFPERPVAGRGAHHPSPRTRLRLG